MLTMKKLYAQHGPNVCRRCINKQYQDNLLPKDCRYSALYLQPCSICGEAHHIVRGFTFSGKLKILFKQQVAKEAERFGKDSTQDQEKLEEIGTGDVYPKV